MSAHRPDRFASPVMKCAMIGVNPTATSAAREDIRKINAVRSQIPQAAKPNGHFSAINVPSVVATPLPPLNLSHIG